MAEEWLDAIKWNDQGLVPAIAQETGTGKILMMAWMNREALAATQDSGHAVYWSRSRGKLWHKGESSGHQQIVKIGRQNGLEAEVLAGLAAGDKVVIHPSDQVEDGVHVRQR